MNGTWVGIVVMGMAVMAPGVRAQEQGGQAPAEALTQPGSAEPSPASVAESSTDQIHQAIRDYIAMIEEDEGAFTIEDEVTGNVRTLTLDRVHEQVSQTEDELFSSSADMRDTGSGETLTVDFDVELWDGEPEVVDARIRAVAGQP